MTDHEIKEAIFNFVKDTNAKLKGEEIVAIHFDVDDNNCSIRFAQLPEQECCKTEEEKSPKKGILSRKVKTLTEANLKLVEIAATLDQRLSRLEKYLMPTWTNTDTRV